MTNPKKMTDEALLKEYFSAVIEYCSNWPNDAFVASKRYKERIEPIEDELKRRGYK